MEFDEHDEDQEEEMEEEIPPLHPQPGYAALGGEAAASSASRKPPGGSFRYRECLKNHAVGIGGSAVDGCGEFMAAGEEGTLDSLRCAACCCHRNFHRRESDSEVGVGGSLAFHHHGGGQPYQHFSPYYRAAPPPSGYLHMTPGNLHRPLALPAAPGRSRVELEDISNPSSSGGAGGGGSGSLKKRSRTKFTPEQKEKMLGFAKRLGWRLQRHDETEVERFCADSGVKRQVLKVWMHNNKNTIGKKT